MSCQRAFGRWEASRFGVADTALYASALPFTLQPQHVVSRCFGVAGVVLSTLTLWESWPLVLLPGGTARFGVAGAVLSASSATFTSQDCNVAHYCLARTAL